MSRTFEVLERVQGDQALFRVPPITNEASESGRTNGSEGSVSTAGASVREEILKIVQCLFLASNGNASPVPRRIVFCGIDDSTGSDLLCARLGRTLAEQVKSQVCIVDANLRIAAQRSSIGLQFSGAEFEGGYVAAPKFTHRVTNNLCILSGESITQDGGARTVDQVQELLKQLTQTFTYWVVSAAPIGSCNDAALLGQMSDGVVLVLEANSTRRTAARRAKQSLEDANVRVLGMVLNARTYPIPEQIYRRL